MRKAARQHSSTPRVEGPRSWLDDNLKRLPQKSGTAEAIRYVLSRWKSLCRFLDDGSIEIDNNAAERAIRPIALGRKNWLFAGADKGGERAAAILSLIETAKLNGLDPEAYLRHVLTSIADHPINRKLCLPRTLTKSVGSFRALPRDRDCRNAPTTVIAGLLATVY